MSRLFDNFRTPYRTVLPGGGQDYSPILNDQRDFSVTHRRILTLARGGYYLQSTALYALQFFFPTVSGQTERSGGSLIILLAGRIGC
jgi:hypothetical protein